MELHTIDTGSRILVTAQDLPSDTFNAGNILEFDGDIYGRYEIVGWDEGTVYFSAKPLDEESKNFSIEAGSYDEETGLAWFDHDGVIDCGFTIIRPDGSMIVHEDTWE